MIHVTCAIIILNNQILVTQRSENMKLPLKWEFPGGKLENNENEIECIKREILEELNIEIEVIKQLSTTIHDYGTYVVNLIPYLSRYVSGEIILAEHKEYKLLDKSELIYLDWAEADIPIVEEFIKQEL